MIGPIYVWESQGRAYGLDEDSALLVRREDALGNPYWRHPTDSDLDKMGGTEGTVLGPELLRIVKSARQQFGGRAEMVFEGEEQS